MENFRYNNLCCPVCNAKLFDDDDIVVCPICGAPHHRNCFNYEGHCHYESTHGTPEQWTMPTADKSENCNTQNEKFHDFDDSNPQSSQEMPFAQPILNFSVQDLEDEIDDNIKAKDVLFFTGSSGFRYLEVFKKQIRNKSAIGWNFIAFFFPELWLASRKMWFLAIPITLINIVLSTILNIIISPVTQAMNLSNSLSAINLLTETEQLIVVSLGLCIIAIGIFFGLFGDYIYRTFAFKKIRALKNDNTFSKEDIASAGGCSLLNIVVMFFAQQAVANLLSIILQSFNL